MGRASKAFGTVACEAPSYNPTEIRDALEIRGPDVWTRYCYLQKCVEEQLAFEARAASNDVAVLREALHRHLPNARQCGRCNFGPVDHKACANLRSHHGQCVGSTHIDNSCPKCHWFSDDIKDWPEWDGTLHMNSDTHGRSDTFVPTELEREQRDRDFAIALHRRLNGNRDLA